MSARIGFVNFVKLSIARGVLVWAIVFVLIGVLLANTDFSSNAGALLSVAVTAVPFVLAVGGELRWRRLHGSPQEVDRRGWRKFTPHPLRRYLLLCAWTFPSALLVVLVTLQFSPAVYSLVVIAIVGVVATAACALVVVPYLRFFRDELWIRSVRGSQVIRGEDVATVGSEQARRHVYPVLVLKTGETIALSTYSSPQSKYSATPHATLAGRVIEQAQELVARTAAQHENDTTDRTP